MGFVLSRAGLRRRWIALISLPVLLASGAAVMVSEAQALGSTATCTLDIQLNLEPGLRLMTRAGTIASTGPGSLDCVGLIDGSPVTGPGTFDVRGRFRGTCGQGTSSGGAAYAIPTRAGTKSGTVDYIVNWAGVVGFITVSDPVYGNGSGPFDFIPVHGNCVTTPLDVIRWSSTQFVISTP
jgi:hypothetical protein